METPKGANELSFRCLDGTNMTEDNVHSVRLALVNGDHLKGGWNWLKAGPIEWTAEADSVRQK